jgi:hypothetical protein
MNNIKITQLAKNIILFENLFENISNTLNLIYDGQWERWNRYGGEKIGEMRFIYKEKDSVLYEEVDKITKFCFESYLKQCNVIDFTHENHEQCNPNWHGYNYFNDSFHIRKWDYPNAGMEPHVDFSTENEYQKAEDQITHTLCVYLNDDYEGGELNFPEHNISIKPPAGSAVVFPSNILHSVSDLINNNRLMWSVFLLK